MPNINAVHTNNVYEVTPLINPPLQAPATINGRRVNRPDINLKCHKDMGFVINGLFVLGLAIAGIGFVMDMSDKPIYKVEGDKLIKTGLGCVVTGIIMQIFVVIFDICDACLKIRQSQRVDLQGIRIEN